MGEGGDGFGHPLAGEGEKGIAGEESVGFAVSDVGGGFAASEVVVVHAGEVVVHEGVGVEGLERGGGEKGGGGIFAEGFADREGEYPAKAFTAVEGGIAHGLVENCGLKAGGGEPAVKFAFDELPSGGKPVGERGVGSGESPQGGRDGGGVDIHGISLYKFRKQSTPPLTLNERILLCPLMIMFVWNVIMPWRHFTR